MRRTLLLVGAPLLALVTGLACGGSSDDSGSPGGDGTGGSQASLGGGAGAGGQASGGQQSLGGSGGSGDEGTAGTSAGGANGGASGAGAGGTPGVSIGYVHSDTTLYSFDPSAPQLNITEVGDFDCVGEKSGQTYAMTDVAVNATGDVWGISADAFYHFELPAAGTGGASGTGGAGGKGAAKVVHCADKVALKSTNKDTRFYALSFAPVGVLDPNKEVLVAGNSAGEIWSISDQGDVTQRGNFGVVPPDDGNGHTYKNAGKAWELSGDIVFLANKGSPVGFATVRDCPNPPDTTGCSSDTLLEIDVPKLKTSGPTDSLAKAVRGKLVTSNTCTSGSDNYDYVAMFGIAAWDANVYGFSHTQSSSGKAHNVALIDNDTGTACPIDSNVNEAWAGAGVTTSAPVKAPPNKIH